MKAIKDLLDKKTNITHAAYTTTQTGTAIDLANYAGNAIFIDPLTLTDGTFTPKLQDSPDNSTWTDVATTSIVGTLAVLASNTQQKVGYIGAQRYVRVVVTVTGSPATGCVFGSSTILNGKRKLP